MEIIKIFSNWQHHQTKYALWPAFDFQKHYQDLGFLLLYFKADIKKNNQQLFFGGSGFTKKCGCLLFFNAAF